MNLPPVVAKRTAPVEVDLELDIHPGLAAFRDHFPEHPILPGVIQIDWAIRLAQQYLGILQSPPQDFQVKFRSIIHPGTKVLLQLQLEPARNRLSFTYKNGDEILSSGIIKLSTA